MSRPCLALDPTGTRIAVPLRYVSGAEAVLTKVRIALQSVRGFWPDNTQFGLPLLEWLANPATPLIEIEGTVRLILSRIEGVLEVVAVEAAKTGGNVAITVRIIVDNGADEALVALVGDIDDPNSPGAWWALFGPNPLVP